MNDVLAAADRNMMRSFEALMGVARGPATVDDGPLLLLASGAPVAFFNPAFVRSPVDDPTAVLDRVAQHYDELGLPYALFFRDETTPGLAAACQDAGLVEHWQMPLMVLDPIPDAGAVPAPPADLEIEEVDASTMGVYGETLCAGFGIPIELMAPILKPELLDVGFVLLLGRVAGEAVSTSAVYVSDDIAGVYNVGTLEAHRGRGIGAALTWAAAAAGRAGGATRSVLQASQLGEPVYRAMGYDTPAHYRQFEQPPAAA